MSGPVALVKGVLSFVDVVNAANEMTKLFDRTPHEDLQKANAVNQCVMSLCILSELGLHSMGASSQKLLWVKNCEVITRLVDIFVQQEISSKVVEGEDQFQKEMKYFSSTISTVASLIKVLFESDYYSEGTYLEMTPEELKQAKRRKRDPDQPEYIPDNSLPNWYETSNDQDGGSQSFSVIPPGFIVNPNLYMDVPVDLTECIQKQKTSKRIADTSAVIRAVSALVNAYTTDLYTRLRDVLHPAAAPVDDDEELNLTTLNFIPTPLHGDAVFRKYICLITTMPIRHVVCDPNGVTLYERSAIRNWLRRNKTSPATRAPLRENQLLARPAVQAEIDNRLREHQATLNAFLQNNHQLPVNAAFQEAAGQEHPE